MAINYTKTTWVNDSAPAINASNLNKIENGIKSAADACDDQLISAAKYTEFCQRLNISE